MNKLGYQISSEALAEQLDHYDQPSSTALVVAEDSRGNGVGRKLIDELEKWVAEN